MTQTNRLKDLELNCEREPDIVFEPNAIVLFVLNVSVELVITIVPLASIS